MGIFRQFPYSNFHDMNMDEILNIVKTMSEEWESTKEEWASYKDFIDNYFATLDVSAEVLQALQAMAASGELNQIIDPTIATETAAWLAEHITPTTPPVDSSLTIEGAAADAKTVGLRAMLFRNRDSSITDAKFIKGIGCYPLQSNWYTDMADIAPSNRYGTLMVLPYPSNSNSQFYQMLIFENGDIYTRWVKSDGSNAGAWDKKARDILALDLKQLDGVTDSKLLRVGFYNVNTNWLTDLQTDFGSDVLGVLFVYGNLNYQYYQVFITETGEVYHRNVASNQQTTGPWHNIGGNEIIKYTVNRSVTTTNLLTQVGFYNINSSWYTDLTALLGNNIVCSLITYGHSTNKRNQMLITETGEIYTRGVTSAGVADAWSKFKSTPINAQGKYIAFGDSRCYGLLAGGGLSNNRYPLFIANALGITYLNQGISGQGFFADDSHVEALATIQNTDISNATLITIEWGVNDWEHPIGVYTDTGDTTICGKLYKIIKYISETNPNATLVVIGSANTAEGVQATSWGYGYTTGSGWSLGALIDEMQRLCDKYKVPFISGYDCPVNDFNIETLMPDDIHFNENGYLMRSRYLLGKVREFYSPN